jgi:DNA-binding PadR family transcriptional regulator
MTTHDTIQTYLPLNETTLFILLSLAPGPKHGYAIAKDVQELSDGGVLLSVSTLYTTLKRFLVNGWIERSDENAETDKTGHPRKIYALTDLGQRILEAETMRLQELARLANQRVFGKQPV